MRRTFIANLILLLPIHTALAAEPSLPMGLGISEPNLPIGIVSGSNDEKTSDSTTTETKYSLPFDITGFAEIRAGQRIASDLHEKDTSIGEARIQLSNTHYWDNFTSNITTDLIYDPVLNRNSNNFENSEGWLDLREANIVAHPNDWSDIKIGRQTLTWGTGDLIFINDMFPKDWNSFFIGRDDEYLKSPSDAAKISLFNTIANIDIIYTPQFDADRYIDGYRLSYFNGNSDEIAGLNNPIVADRRADAFSEDEIHIRLNKIIDGYETAAYFYKGYWKSPNGQTSGGTYIFPNLNVYGASIRGPIGTGIFNTEFGYYDSTSDDNGDDPLIRNSELRFLVGYEQELAPNLTGSIQYYIEHIQDYKNYIDNLPIGTKARDKNRHLFTLRLTKLLMNQNLNLSLFNFYSPSDKDGYIRPKINYKINDSYTLELGGNIFYEHDKETFFSQFKNNNNIYTSLRYSF